MGNSNNKKEKQGKKKKMKAKKKKKDKNHNKIKRKKKKENKRFNLRADSLLNNSVVDLQQNHGCSRFKQQHQLTTHLPRKLIGGAIII